MNERPGITYFSLLSARLRMGYRQSPEMTHAPQVRRRRLSFERRLNPDAAVAITIVGPFLHHPKRRFEKRGEHFYVAIPHVSVEPSHELARFLVVDSPHARDDRPRAGHLKGALQTQPPFAPRDFP